MERVRICMSLQTTMQKIAEIEAEVGAVAVCCFCALCVRPRVLLEVVWHVRIRVTTRQPCVCGDHLV